MDYKGRDECTHGEYYRQFVTNELKQVIRDVIGMHAILGSTNKYFNDISIDKWHGLFGIRIRCGVPDPSYLYNRLGKPVLDKIHAAGAVNVSIADLVCTAKEAARQLREAAQ
jgi:hypothetical protein